MKWNESIKQEISYFSALLVLVFGIGLTIASFCVPPLGVVHESILWILGQSLLYTGSVFSLTLYVNSQMRKIQKNCLDKIEDMTHNQN